MSQFPGAQNDGAWRYGVRAVLSLAVDVSLIYWVYFALYLAAFSCEGTCVDAEDWRYVAQVVIAGVGCLAGIAAAALGFTSRARAYRACLIAAVCCGLVWFAWVGVGGNF